MENYSPESLELSPLFVKNRDLGLVCNSLPPIFQKRETASYVIACTGPSFHIYDVEKLELMFIGPNYDLIYPCIKEEISISAMTAIGDLTIIALLPFGVLSFCERGKEIFSLRIEGFSTSNPIMQLEAIGEHLFALFEDGKICQIDSNTKGINQVVLCFFRNCSVH